MKEKISPSTRAYVLLRDGYRCVAPTLDGRAGWCRDAFGNIITHWWSHDPGPQYLQMSHTKASGAIMLGKKAPSDPGHLISLCPFHHTGTKAGSNWEALHRETIRRHLEQLQEPVREKDHETP